MLILFVMNNFVDCKVYNEIHNLICCKQYELQKGVAWNTYTQILEKNYQKTISNLCIIATKKVINSIHVSIVKYTFYRESIKAPLEMKDVTFSDIYFPLTKILTKAKDDITYT